MTAKGTNDNKTILNNYNFESVEKPNEEIILQRFLYLIHVCLDYNYYLVAHCGNYFNSYGIDNYEEY